MEETRKTEISIRNKLKIERIKNNTHCFFFGKQNAECLYEIFLCRNFYN